MLPPNRHHYAHIVLPTTNPVHHLKAEGQPVNDPRVAIYNTETLAHARYNEENVDYVRGVWFFFPLISNLFSVVYSKKKD